jgi:subtilisin family serine protease
MPLIQASEAWEHSTGEGIIVAVTDNGFELEHEDLENQWFVNEKEIPDNDIDDDNNGYVDDVLGYDFNDEDNDVNPTGFFGDDHGTHVSGIIAAEANNELGVAGIAPGVKIMPLKFTGGRSWSSDIIAETYKYAADNGAKIITTSYFIDKWVGNKLFEESIQYVYDRGIIHFNSAGNGYKKNSARQAFGELVLVCSTEANEDDADKVSDFSNTGWGIDVCAPGGGDTGILSTSTKGKYKRNSGTSMASPAAAAVAALIWSKNPTFTRDQVLATLYGTADDIDELNSEDYPAGYMGAGRINALKAVTTKATALPLASIREVKANLSSDEAENTIEIYFTKKSVLNPENMRDLLNYRLTYSQDSIFGNGDDKALSLEFKSDFLSNSNRVVLNVGEAKPGTFKLRIQGLLEDAFGRSWDGNGDGVAGGAFIKEIVRPETRACRT